MKQTVSRTSTPGAVRALLRRSVGLLICAAALGAAARPAQAVPMKIDYTDSAGVGFNDPSLGTARRTAFEAAVGAWSARLGGNIPILINAYWQSLAPGTQLASGQPSTFIAQFTGAPNAKIFYPIALANEIANTDLTTTFQDHHEITIRFNLDVDTAAYASKFGGNFYYGVDGNCGTNFDFFSTCMHELCHSLGFTGLLQQDGSFNGGMPSVFDTFLAGGPTAGAPLLTAQSNSARAASETSSSLYFSGPAAAAANAGQNVKLYAPNPYLSGSSVYHLDQSTFFTTSPLIVPATYPGLPIHDPGPVIMGILKDLGWTINPGAASGPGVSFVSVGGNLSPSSGATFAALDSEHPIVVCAPPGARTVLVFIRHNSDLRTDAAASADPSNVPLWWNPSTHGWQSSKAALAYVTPANQSVPVQPVFGSNLPAGLSLPTGTYYFEADSYDGAGDVSTTTVGLSTQASTWLAQDLAVGSDNQARLLWQDRPNQISLWSVSNSGGVSSSGILGPYSQFRSRAVATGADGLTRLLWNRTDGTAALWLMTQGGAVQSYFGFGPFPGWTAIDVTVGSDNLSRMLWCNLNGAMILWSVDSKGATTTGPIYGPYSGWSPAHAAAGADGLTWVLWNNTSGAASVWTLGQDNGYRNSFGFGPYAGWTALDVTVGSDNKARILWGRTDGAMIVWAVDSSGGVASGPVYGPYPGYTPVSLAAGSDGLTRVLWNNVSGAAAVWLMNADNTYQNSFGFGPY